MILIKFIKLFNSLATLKLLKVVHEDESELMGRVCQIFLRGSDPESNSGLIRQKRTPTRVALIGSSPACPFAVSFWVHVPCVSGLILFQALRGSFSFRFFVVFA